MADRSRQEKSNHSSPELREHMYISGKLQWTNIHCFLYQGAKLSKILAAFFLLHSRRSVLSQTVREDLGMAAFDIHNHILMEKKNPQLITH